MKSTVDGVLAASGTALASALLLFGIAAGRAVRADAARVDIEPTLITPVSLTDSASEVSRLQTVTIGEIAAAADRDPFRADRRRPPQPYRIGGVTEPESDVDPDSVQSSVMEFPAFRLLGTLATTSGGLAVIDIPGLGTRVVSVGHSIGGFRLTAVGSGTATLAIGDSQHTLRVARPSPQAGMPASPANQQQAPNRASVNRAPAQDQARSRELEEVRRRARERFRNQGQQGGVRIRGGNGQQRGGGQF